ncbi:hypothetical protein BJF90_07610 [Pseudonocardia sp. CNS-004]|nr:hypothetical protein BJF90_07610 [Pseudonocardia sp. CNS-004]
MAKTGVPREALEKAYAEFSRAASRSSLMGALGFGIALVIGVPVVREGNPFGGGHGLELILVAGAVGGGIVFTVLALRASRMARDCQRRLRGTGQPKRR